MAWSAVLPKAPLARRWKRKTRHQVRTGCIRPSLRKRCAKPHSPRAAQVLRGKPLVMGIAGTTAPLVLALRDDCAKLTLSLPGSVGLAAGEERFYTVYAVPDFDSTEDVVPQTLRPSTGGKITLTGLTPGNYHVYTFDRPTALEYRNPAVLASLPGQAVTLAPGAEAGTYSRGAAAMKLSSVSNAQGGSSARRSCGVRCSLRYGANTQTQSSSPSITANALSGPYRIAGVLVNAATGEPVRRATVEALNEDDSHAVASCVTDNDGRFALEQAGRREVSADRIEARIPHRFLRRA